MYIITDLKDPSNAMKKFLSVKIIFSEGVKMHPQRCSVHVKIWYFQARLANNLRQAFQYFP